MPFKTGFNVLLLSMVTLYGSVVHAANETKRMVPFQGRLHGTEGKVVSDGVYDITFSVYDTPTGGAPVWTEIHESVSSIHGYINVLLGALVPMHEVNYSQKDAFKDAYHSSKNIIDFTTEKYLGISIAGGAEMFPRTQLVPSFHAYTANHADHATRADDADNADNLGELPANTYAQKSYVTGHVNTLNTRIDTEIADVDAKFNGNNAKNADLLGSKAISHFATDARMDTVEGKFTGSKAKDADKLDNVDISQIARTDLHETFNSHLSVKEDVLIGFNGGGDASLRFYDDNSNDWRYIQWDDSLNRFRAENDAGQFSEFGVPVGTIVMWPRHTSLPNGYVPCDGRLLSKTTYNLLYSILGTVYGSSGNDFRVPDYRGRFVRAWDGGSGRDPDSRSGGSSGVGSTQGYQIQSHYHYKANGGFDIQAGGAGTLGFRYNMGDNNGYDNKNYDLRAGGKETRPINISAVYIIKYM